MTASDFQLPIWFDLGATFAFAMTGALAAIKRGYDVVGLFFLALASGIGGGLLRDALFIRASSTALLTNPAYIYVVLAGVVAAMALGSHVHRFRRVIALIDALGLGAYACFGVQKSLHAGLAAPAAVLVGVINAAGGGLVRDLLTGEEPLVFRPGQFYVLAALLGAVTFVFLVVQLQLPGTMAALLATTLTFLVRVLTVSFNWRTAPIAPTDALPPAP
ncbi:TRIC cation channel family protein [Horticoccus luteus]|uniref:TRIC cation channel family protein n=1 Tax=Horticoccus luteus TaxID=2862869 RepID=A0A8F9TWW8_9BACT|nr:TRIC cation channel family protein [Horticoccus luteus]QYM79052.1 TRIC cation channel family protein [Horticoccus luteus]